jgi:hypothetical protein
LFLAHWYSGNCPSKSFIIWSLSVFAKIDGKANNENKYDFPPPIDTKLFFGSCAIVAQLLQGDNKYQIITLTFGLWQKIYEKLFGGFENLDITCIEDENEIDELDDIPKHKKTKEGYLKDDFVVDSDGDIQYDSDGLSSKSSESVIELEEDDKNDEIYMADIGSELSEEAYDYESQIKST